MTVQTRNIPALADVEDTAAPAATQALIRSLTWRTPGLMYSLAPEVHLTYGDLADAVDAVVEKLDYWSARALAAEAALAALHRDVAAFRRILGTTPTEA